MALRGYQEALLDGARARLRAGVARLLLQLPTGGGKTVLAAEMLGGAARKGLRSWFVVHRKELLDQTSRTFAAMGIDHGFIATDYPINPRAPVQLCGIHTLANRLVSVDPPDLIVWDEAHHAVAGTWSRVMNVLPSARHIGLTATPERLDGRGLKDHFDEMLLGPTTAELIAEGHLSPYRYFAPGQPDLLGVRTTAGDFNRGDLAKVMEDKGLIGDVVASYQRHASGMQGIVFAVDTEHSRLLAGEFRAAGILAEHVDGSMKKAERGAKVEAFRRGEIAILTNCELFGEGFDVPAVSYVGLARPTQSLSLHLQQVGRALRVLPGKSHAIICDHAGNAFRNGLPDDDRTWTLEGRKKGKGRAVGPSDALSIRQCTECYQVSPSTASECPGCGFVFPVRSRTPETGDGELFELTRIEAAKQQRERRKREERECKTLEEFTALGERRGYANPSGWAYNQVRMRHQYAARFRRRAG